MELTKTKYILSILKPIELNKEIANLYELEKVIHKNNPKYTVLPKDFFESVLKYAHSFKNLGNVAWVQLGVWKGGGALFFKALMNELGIVEKLYLIDTFGSIPTIKLKHEKDLEFTNMFDLKNQTNYINNVKNLFDEFNLRENVIFIESDIHDVEKKDVPSKIGFLFIDLDFYEPVFKSLELLYDNVVSGGVIIIDDYYNELFNCKTAVDDFFLSKNIDLLKHSKKFSNFSLMFIKP